jgi:hypothetical protein
MNRPRKLRALISALPLIFSMSAALGFSTAALADEPPSPSTPEPGSGAGRHHNPAFAACKKQADDQKIAAGDARRDFMKNCMKSAPATPSS